MNRSVLAAMASAIAFGASVASADLIITEVLPQTTAGTTNTINGDWWELTNTGPTAINLAGYQWADSEDILGGATPQPNFFPSVTINAGQSIIILEEAAANEAAWRTNWNAPSTLVILGTDEMLPSPGVTDTFSGLGAGGDAVYFYSPSGLLLSSYIYTSTTRGVSFEASNTGADLGLSVEGVNGAIRAANRDVGSPGFAVPSPSAGALLVLAAFGAGRRRVAR